MKNTVYLLFVMLTPFGVGAVQASFMGGYRVTSETAGYKAVSDTLPYVKKTTLLTLGDTVKAGQPIALTGRTGRASTEHLHFETRVNGQHFDPNIIFNMKEQTLNRQRIGCSKKGNGIVVQQLPTIYPKPLQKKYPMELFKYPNVSLHLQNVSLKERIELKTYQ